MLKFEDENQASTMGTAKIKVLGVGGGGNNMIDDMIESGYENIEFIAANTDSQALNKSKASHKIQLGVKSAKGLGAGANPELGRRAAEEDIDKIIKQLEGADVVFLVAGLGGGTGSGSLPPIARALKELDILVVAVVTKPFTFEGKRRMKVAQESLDLLINEVDTIIVMPNQKLIEHGQTNVSLVDAFKLINNVLNQFVKSIADIITKPGHINVDFADIKSIMKQKGFAVIGTARTSGPDKATLAVLQAISSPLLENIDISGARGVLINICGSSSLGLHEVSQAATIIYEKAHEDANIILGYFSDESLKDDVVVTVIATGFNQNNNQAEAVLSPAVTTTKFKPVEVERNTESSHEPMVKPSKIEKDEIDLADIDIPTVIRKMAEQRHNSN